MRKFAGNYLSGRVKTTGPNDVESDRYTYLSLDQAEPNFGVPTNDITSLSGSAGDNVFMMSTAGGIRRLVSIGDDLSLEEIGQSGYYKIGLSAEATTNSVNLSTNASSLQTTLQVGMLANRPIRLTSPQDVSRTEVESGSFQSGTVYRITQTGQQDWGSIDDHPDPSSVTYGVGVLFKATGAGTSYASAADKGKAVAVPSFSTIGGISVGRTVQLNNSEKIVWIDPNPGSVSNPEKHDVSIKSTHSSSPGESFLSFKVGGVQGLMPWAGSSGWDDANQHAVRIVANKNYYTGKQISTLILGRATADGGNIIAGDDQDYKGNSESIIQGNQTIIIDPVAIDSETGTVKIRGDLEVLGTQTTVNSTTLDVADLNITVAKDATTSSTTNNAGLTFGTSVGTPTAPAVTGEWNNDNPVPVIVWSDTGSRIATNKSFEATSFITTDQSVVGFLKSDGSVDTGTYQLTSSAVNSQYDLTVTAGTNTGTFQLEESGTQNADTIDIVGDGGISVNTYVKTVSANAKIEIDGSGVSGTEYTLTTDTNAQDNTQVDLNLTAVSGNTSSNDTITFKGGSGIAVSTGSDDELIIAGTNTPVYSANGAKVTITNSFAHTTTPTDFDLTGLALSASSATSGAVAKFSRTTEGDLNYGGVLILELKDNTTANANPWISFMNPGDTSDGVSQPAINDSALPCQGEITTKQTDGANKSGIRIWGQRNIDFDVSNNAKPSSNMNETRLSIDGTGLILRNTSTITSQGTVYKTVYSFGTGTSSNQDSTITFPDLPNGTTTGTVAYVETLEAGGPITTVDGTSNADHFVVFAETAVSPAGTDQDPLTNTKLKFNPSTGALTLTGTLTATAKSFLIDHPTKDAMKLQYASLEGPENGVYVRGRLKDSNIIELPDYWTGLVDETTITVNLTPVGSHQNLFVQDINDNQIIVGCDEPVNCFYTIFGERKDIEQLVVEYEDQ